MKVESERWKFFKKNVVTRLGDDSSEPKPYLIRWNIFSTPWFGIKLHKILLSDDDCLHDHPWSFLSIIIKGGYFETTTERTSSKSVYNIGSTYYGIPSKYITWHGPGSILWRPNPFPHRLELKAKCVNFSTGKKELKPAWTFVITFKRTREWGFYTPAGWLSWRKYNSSSKCE